MTVTLLLIIVMAGCQTNAEGESSDQSTTKLQIYTTVYPLEYIVEQLGRDSVEVETVYPPGADGHTYEPTTQDMTNYAQSDAFIYVGDGMEAFSETISDPLENQEVELIRIADNEALFQKGETADEHSEGGSNSESESEPVDTIIDDHEDNGVSNNDGEVNIEGVAGHYHTGDTIVLTASHNKEPDSFRWYTKPVHSDQWEIAENQNSETFEGEATEEIGHVKVALLDEDGDEITSSEAADIIIDDHEEFAPHIWVDPLKMIEVAEIVKNELIALNPDQEEHYNSNFEELKENLTSLDNEFIEQLEEKENKKIIVPHAAFGYWEERYGVEQIPIRGFSMSEEPSQRQLTELSDTAEENNLDYVLFEQNNSDARLPKVIQEQIDADARIIHNLEVRTEEDINDEEDYISLMRRNLEVLDEVTD